MSDARPPCTCDSGDWPHWRHDLLCPRRKDESCVECRPDRRCYLCVGDHAPIATHPHAARAAAWAAVRAAAWDAANDLLERLAYEALGLTEEG